MSFVIYMRNATARGYSEWEMAGANEKIEAAIRHAVRMIKDPENIGNQFQIYDSVERERVHKDSELRKMAASRLKNGMLKKSLRKTKPRKPTVSIRGRIEQMYAPDDFVRYVGRGGDAGRVCQVIVDEGKKVRVRSGASFSGLPSGTGMTARMSFGSTIPKAQLIPWVPAKGDAVETEDGGEFRLQTRLSTESQTWDAIDQQQYEDDERITITIQSPPAEWKPIIGHVPSSKEWRDDYNKRIELLKARLSEEKIALKRASEEVWDLI